MSDDRFCTDCGGGPWPPQRFYRAGKRRDGSIRLDAKCKDCRKRINGDYRLAHTEQISKRDKERYAQPEYKQRKDAQHRRYVKTIRGKAARRRATRAWRVTHPELYDAQKRRSAAALKAQRVQSPHWSPDENRTERRTHEADGVRGDASVTG